MRAHTEIRQRIGWKAIFMQVAPHQKRSLAGLCDAVDRLVVSVAGIHDGGFDFACDPFRDFLDPDYERRRYCTGLERQVSLAKRKASGGSGCFDGDGFNAPQPGKISQKRSQLGLA